MNRDPRAAGPTVRLHLHRGIGWGLYGTLTVVVFLLVVLGVGSSLLDGSYLMAAALAVFGLAMSAFLGLLTHSMVVPALTATAAGVTGRLPRGSRVDVGWDQVTIDVADPPRPGTLRLLIGTDAVTVDSRSWIGFRELVILGGSTPAAVARLTPAGRGQVAGLLGLEG